MHGGPGAREPELWLRAWVSLRRRSFGTWIIGHRAHGNCNLLCGAIPKWISSILLVLCHKPASSSLQASLWACPEGLSKQVERAKLTCTLLKQSPTGGLPALLTEESAHERDYAVNTLLLFPLPQGHRCVTVARSSTDRLCFLTLPLVFNCVHKGPPQRLEASPW